jgi:hypothetical protein
MLTEEILKSLCNYDTKNPDCSLDDEDIEDHKRNLLKVSKKLGYNKSCSCDNCFYNRTILAEELLKMIATTKIALKQAFEAGQETIFEDLAQTTRCAKFDSFEDWFENRTK